MALALGIARLSDKHEIRRERRHCPLRNRWCLDFRPARGPDEPQESPPLHEDLHRVAALGSILGAYSTSRAIETSKGSTPARQAISSRRACRIWARIRSPQTCRM